MENMGFNQNGNLGSYVDQSGLYMNQQGQMFQGNPGVAGEQQQFVEGQGYMQSAEQGIEPFNDAAAIQFFNNHSNFHRPITDMRECGAVIRGNGALAPTGWGTTSDAIGPLLDGIGVSRIHEGPIRNIARFSTSYAMFEFELSRYIQAHGLPRWPNMSGLVHCHPNSTLFSPQDDWLSRFFNIPVYVVTAVGSPNRFSQLWRLRGGSITQLR